jgi:hypothetical protein
MPKLFNLGLYQQRFGGNHKLAGASINLGSTRGKASSTRMFNYCNQRTNNGTCLYPFITLQK